MTKPSKNNLRPLILDYKEDFSSFCLLHNIDWAYLLQLFVDRCHIYSGWIKNVPSSFVWSKKIFDWSMELINREIQPIKSEKARRVGVLQVRKLIAIGQHEIPYQTIHKEVSHAVRAWYDATPRYFAKHNQLWLPDDSELYLPPAFCLMCEVLHVYPEEVLQLFVDHISFPALTARDSDDQLESNPVWAFMALLIHGHIEGFDHKLKHMDDDLTRRYLDKNNLLVQKMKFIRNKEKRIAAYRKMYENWCQELNNQTLSLMEYTVSIKLPKDFRLICEIFGLSVREILQQYVNEVSLVKFMTLDKGDELLATRHFVYTMERQDSFSTEEETDIHSKFLDRFGEIALDESRTREDKEKDLEEILLKWKKEVLIKRGERLPE